MSIARRKRKPRADAETSIVLILRAAESVLDTDPHAPLEEVASAAGLSRMTLYRHFKTREELLETLTIESFKEALATSDAFDRGARFDEGLRELTFEFLKPSAKWRAIAFHPRGSRMVTQLRHDLYKKIDSIIDIGVKTGFVAGSANRVWLRYAYLGLVSQAKRREKDLGLAPKDLAKLIITTFLSGVSEAAL